MWNNSVWTDHYSSEVRSWKFNVICRALAAQWRSSTHWMVEIFRNNTENKTGNVVKPLHKSTVCSSSPTTTKRNSRIGKVHRIATNTFHWGRTKFHLKQPWQPERGSQAGYKVMTGLEKAKLFSVLSKARSRVHQMVSWTVRLKAREVILHAYNLTMELPATGYYGCSKFTSSRGPTRQNSGGDTLSTAKEVDRTTDLRSH